MKPGAFALGGIVEPLAAGEHAGDSMPNQLPWGKWTPAETSEAAAHAFADLMARVGFALWQLQEVETVAAAHVVVRVRGHRGMGREAGEALLANAERSTFGTTLKALERAGVLPSDLTVRLQQCLEDRNWLAHRARREHRGVIADPAAYARLSERLDRLAADALSLLKELEGQHHAYVVSQGVNPADIEAAAQRLARSWGFTC